MKRTTKPTGKQQATPPAPSKPKKKEKEKKKRITNSAAKQKGRLLQQWACEKISEITGFEHGKDMPIESRPMGQSGTDVRMEKRVLQKFPFSVECKRQETLHVPKWAEQAKANQLRGTDWLLICKQSNKPALVILDADAFFAIYSKIIQGHDPKNNN